MDLVERILRHREHSHIRTELLDQSLDDCLTGSVGRDPYAFRRNFLSAVLKVESHNSVKLELLRNYYNNKEVLFNRSIFFHHLVCVTVAQYSPRSAPRVRRDPDDWRSIVVSRLEEPPARPFCLPLPQPFCKNNQRSVSLAISTIISFEIIHIHYQMNVFLLQSV